MQTIDGVYVNVCVVVCPLMYMCVYVCVYIVCVYACVHVMCACTCVYTYVLECLHVCMYFHVFVNNCDLTEYIHHLCYDT